MLHFFAKRLKELHEKERGERGFTLIELLVVMDLTRMGRPGHALIMNAVHEVMKDTRNPAPASAP
jgi:pilin/secretion family protein with methylation motif